LGKEIPETPFAKFAYDFVSMPWFKKIAKNKIKSHCTGSAVLFYKYEIFSEYTEKFLKILYKIRNLPQLQLVQVKQMPSLSIRIVNYAKVTIAHSRLDL
jgi:hypothetical protein